VHHLVKMKGDANRLLISFVSGAICIYNVAKRFMEYSTEAGHAETVFDLKFCPSNRDIVGSCSYDGTVRVWNVNQMKLIAINDTFRNT
jgi:WD repeat-containing protein 17